MNTDRTSFEQIERQFPQMSISLAEYKMNHKEYNDVVKDTRRNDSLWERISDFYLDYFE